MSTYKTTFEVSVSIEMEIEATSESSVRKLIQDNLIITADLVDAESVSFSVIEDSINDLNMLEVSQI